MADNMKVRIVDDKVVVVEQLEESLDVKEELSFSTTGVDHSDTIRKIERGTLQWFVAKVTAFEPDGTELGEDYLGGCIYKDLDDFIENSMYFKDMVAEAIQNGAVRAAA